MLPRISFAFALLAFHEVFAASPACVLLNETGISARSALLEGTSLSRTPTGWKLGGRKILVRWGEDFEGSPRDTLEGPLELRELEETDIAGLVQALLVSELAERPLSIGGGDETSDPPEGCEAGQFALVGSHALRLDRRFPVPAGIGPVWIQGGELVARKPTVVRGARISHAIVDRSGAVIVGHSPEPWIQRLDGSLEIVASRGIAFLGKTPDVASAKELTLRLLPRYADSARCGVADSRLWTWTDGSGSAIQVARALRLRKSGDSWLSEEPVRARWGFANLEGRLQVRNWTDEDDGGKPRILIALLDPSLSTPWSTARKLPGEVFLPDEGWRNRAIALERDTIRGDLPLGAGGFLLTDSLVLTSRPNSGTWCREYPVGLLDKHIRLERDGVTLAPWYRSSKVGRMSFFPWPAGFDPAAVFDRAYGRTWSATPPIADTLTWRDFPGIGKYRTTGELGLPSRDSVDLRVLVALDSSWAPLFEFDTFPMVLRTAWNRTVDPGSRPRLVCKADFLQNRIGDHKDGLSGIDTLETKSFEGRSTFVARGTGMFLRRPGSNKGRPESKQACRLTPALECLAVE